MNRALLLAFAPVLLGIAGLACNGQVSDETGSLTSKQRVGQQEQEKQKEAQASAPTTPSGTTDNTRCDYGYQSSSGGGDGKGSYFCESTDHFTCSGAAEEISCKCDSQNGQWNTGTCGCANGVTFEFDCNNGCSPGPAEYAKCNLPAPPKDDSGYGTTSSTSSSGSSGSSSGSSGSSSSSSGG